MNILPRKKVILLGMMSKHVVAGVVWQTIHYLVGLKRLGYEVYYVESHGMTPKDLMSHEDDDGSLNAAAFISRVMCRFDLEDCWAFHAIHSNGQYYGMSESQLKHHYRTADLIINLHGATEPLPEHYENGRLVYLETDPVELQIELYNNLQRTIDFLEPHCAFFTFGENYGKPDCKLPVTERFHFKPTRQPVVLDFWRPSDNGNGAAFTTIGNWRQLRLRREVEFQGEIYQWSKHYEFMKFIDLPSRATDAKFELSLSSYDESDRQMLESHGWHVQNALSFSIDLDSYRQYINDSRGEFTVAKDQNVRLRSGWFSDRSATYLAAGRPVITQETGFSNILPAGAGLFGFTNMEEAMQAIEAINSDYAAHAQAASNIAKDYFDSRVVLTQMLSDVGI